MGATLDISAFTPALKQLYPEIQPAMMVYKDNPILAMLPKMEEFYGLNMLVPTIFSNPQGRSATFATALANKTASQLKGFTITRNHDYGLANIDYETILASQSDKGAFLRAAKMEIDGTIHAVGRSLATAVAGSGTGSIGQISAGSNVGTATITLADITQVTNFEVGMVLQLSATDGAAPRTGTVTLTGVDRGLGTLTASGNWTAGIAAAAASDFILVQGDSNAKVRGLAAWLPLTAPTGGDSFFGVDRSADPSRLAGVRYDGSSQSIEEALVDGLVRIAREGGKPGYGFVNFERFGDLEKALGSKVHYVTVPSAVPGVGFSGIEIMGPKQKVTIIPDQNLPGNLCYMLQMDTWKLYSLGKAPMIQNLDGLEMLRLSNGDSLEIRVAYYAQLGCTAPGFNGVIKLQ